MKPMHVLLSAFKTFALAALATFLAVNASAQSDWPKAKPVTLVVAFAPGASTDIVAR
jgi:tripartite-type tricarboxylate transporter receptor subunit TctC